MESADDLNEIRRLLRDIAGALDGLDESDAAAVEVPALELVAPFADPDFPPDAAGLLTAVLEERGDEPAAAVLAAVAELAPERIATAAAPARDRLARAGTSAPLAGAIGTLRECECYRFAVLE